MYEDNPAPNFWEITRQLSTKMVGNDARELKSRNIGTNLKVLRKSGELRELLTTGDGQPCGTAVLRVLFTMPRREGMTALN